MAMMFRVEAEQLSVAVFLQAADREKPVKFRLLQPLRSVGFPHLLIQAQRLHRLPLPGFPVQDFPGSFHPGASLRLSVRFITVRKEITVKGKGTLFVQHNTFRLQSDTGKFILVNPGRQAVTQQCLGIPVLFALRSVKLKRVRGVGNRSASQGTLLQHGMAAALIHVLPGGNHIAFFCLSYMMAQILALIKHIGSQRPSVGHSDILHIHQIALLPFSRQGNIPDPDRGVLLFRSLRLQGAESNPAGDPFHIPLKLQHGLRRLYVGIRSAQRIYFPASVRLGDSQIDIAHSLLRKTGGYLCDHKGFPCEFVDASVRQKGISRIPFAHSDK